jgi:hypothetical protein
VNAESHSIAHTVPETGRAVRTASTTILIDRCVKPTVRVYREPTGGRLADGGVAFHRDTRLNRSALPMTETELNVIDVQWNVSCRLALVSRVRNSVTYFPGAAPAWQGATTENTQRI